jgi:acetyl-CoA C-acetyltransferase/acetyl-CoA acyltransferase
MKKRIAIIDGIRTPFCKSGGVFKNIAADDLGAIVVKELLARIDFPPESIEEMIFGNVAQPAHAANIARVVALKAGLPPSLVAHTVHRNCASGMQSITSAANLILSEEAEVVLAGGTESMSQIPILYSKALTEWLFLFMKAKTLGEKIKTFLKLRLAALKPVIGLEEGLTDPICGLSMGMTAEVLSRAFHVSREEQDLFSLESHKRASAAIQKGFFAQEIIPVPIPPDYGKTQHHDDGPRANQTLEALQKLKPYFDRKTGSVTVGNACPVTDGAACVLLMSENKAKEMHLSPLGYLRDYTYAALEGRSMGLGPVYATSKLLDKTQLTMKDFQLIEMNEAFAAQILANEKAFASAEFSKKTFGKNEALGALDRDRLNVNGGAIALGHPVGTSGTRLVLTLLKELRRRNLNLGLATLCVGGGQGAALALEVN